MMKSFELGSLAALFGGYLHCIIVVFRLGTFIYHLHLVAAWRSDGCGRTYAGIWDVRGSRFFGGSVSAATPDKRSAGRD